jgi:Raf kinase inhibitor-like YbhB/YbcL family protein
MMRNQLLIAFVMAAASLPAQTPTAPPAMRPRLILETTAFEDGGAVSPRLTWNNVPDGTVSFAVLVIDPDTALNKTTDQVLHWGIFNIPAAARELPEGVASDAQLPDGSIQLINQNKKVGYLGMGAPAGGPYHHYTFALYALDTKLVVAPDASMADAMKTMDGHILAKAVLVGRFHRP